jgi:hypothetical protein
MKETIIPKGRAMDNRVNVYLNRETAELLAKFKDELGKTLGVDLSYAQAIQYLVKHQPPKTE